MYLNEVTVYCEIIAREIGSGLNHALSFRCIKRIPSEHEASTFLNRIFTDGKYEKVIAVKEVSKEYAEKIGRPSDYPVIAYNFFEISAVSGVSEKEMLCVTAVDKTLMPDTIINAVNKSRAESEKIIRLNYAKSLSFDEATAKYGPVLYEWMTPLDVASDN